MGESEPEAIWTAIQEFIPALQRHDPTLRRWLVPQSDAALLLDLYGEEGLLTLLKDYRAKERFILLRTAALPREEGHVRLAEIAWADPGKAPPTQQDRVTLRLRKVRRRWLVEDLWPAALDAPPTVDQARADWAEQEEHADPAAIFLAGAATTPLEGCGELDDVETLFVLGMDARGYSPREVIRAVRLWRDFRECRPSYRQPAAFAAAVEYIFSLLGLYGDTSRQRIAAEYGVKPGSLGQRFAQVRDCLGLVFFDQRYSAFGPAPREVQEHWQTSTGLPFPPPLRGRLDGFPAPPALRLP
jgi:hypothetical protein